MVVGVLMRRRLGIITAALAGLLLLGGCAVVAPLAEPRLAPPEPFGDFSVGEFGGVDGRQNILRVRADGVALSISSRPAAGRIDADTMRRLRELLTSEQFRMEVARENERPTDDPVRCSDQITTEVRMGTLVLRRSDPCGSRDRPPAPAFSEIWSLLADARRGAFAAAVGATGPALVPVRVERLTDPGYVITVDAAGAGTVSVAGGPARPGRLDRPQQDTLRLLLAELRDGGNVTCSATARYRIQIDGAEVRPDCNRRYPEQRSTLVLLEDAFGV